MGGSSALKLFTIVLLLVALCYGKDQHTYRTENTHIARNATEDGVTPVLQHGYYDNDSAPRGVLIVTPIVTLLLIGCCVYFCCRCRSQRNQGVVVSAAHPTPAAHTIIFQQPPVQQMPYQQQQPPVQQMPYPQQQPPIQQMPHPQQHAPPPYDTQAYPLPTAFENPNYAPQPPVNMQYGQEKY